MVAATAEAEELVATSVRIKNQTAAAVCVMRLPFRRVPDEVEVASLQSTLSFKEAAPLPSSSAPPPPLLIEEEKTRKDSFLFEVALERESFLY